MSFSAVKPLILLSILAVTTGCATKITLGPISDDLKPQAKVAAKVHVLPIVDNAVITKFDNDYYSTVSGAVEKTNYISATHPTEMLGKSIVSCLTQSGLTVTSGATVPQDADIVLTPSFRSLYIGASGGAQAYAIAATLVTGMATTSDPYAEIFISNSLEDRKSNAKLDAVFRGWERSMLHFTKGGGAERSYRLVQEKYCGWLQQKLAGFKADPVAAERLNKEDLAALNKDGYNK